MHTKANTKHKERQPLIQGGQGRPDTYEEDIVGQPLLALILVAWLGIAVIAGTIQRHH